MIFRANDSTAYGWDISRIRWATTLSGSWPDPSIS